MEVNFNFIIFKSTYFYFRFDRFISFAISTDVNGALMSFVESAMISEIYQNGSEVIISRHVFKMVAKYFLLETSEPLCVAKT